MYQSIEQLPRLIMVFMVLSVFIKAIKPIIGSMIAFFLSLSLGCTMLFVLIFLFNDFDFFNKGIAEYYNNPQKVVQDVENQLLYVFSVLDRL
jgi:hypothetical protein